MTSFMDLVERPGRWRGYVPGHRTVAESVRAGTGAKWSVTVSGYRLAVATEVMSGSFSPANGGNECFGAAAGRGDVVLLDLCGTMTGSGRARQSAMGWLIPSANEPRLPAECRSRIAEIRAELAAEDAAAMVRAAARAEHSALWHRWMDTGAPGGEQFPADPRPDGRFATVAEAVAVWTPVLETARELVIAAEAEAVYVAAVRRLQDRAESVARFGRLVAQSVADKQSTIVREWAELDAARAQAEADAKAARMSEDVRTSRRSREERVDLSTVADRLAGELRQNPFAALQRP